MFLGPLCLIALSQSLREAPPSPSEFHMSSAPVRVHVPGHPTGIHKGQSTLLSQQGNQSYLGLSNKGPSQSGWLTWSPDRSTCNFVLWAKGKEAGRPASWVKMKIKLRGNRSQVSTWWLKTQRTTTPPVKRCLREMTEKLNLWNCSCRVAQTRPVLLTDNTSQHDNKDGKKIS